MKDYALSEQLFLDLWEKYGYKEELSNSEEIFDFLNELIQANHSLIVHYSKRSRSDY